MCSRRELLGNAGRLLVALNGAQLLGAAARGAERGQTVPGSYVSQAARSGRLSARPAKPRQVGPRGLSHLDFGEERDGLLFVPDSWRPSQRAPLVLLLHGAGGQAKEVLRLLQRQAEEAGVIVLAPDSRRATWDVIAGGYGPDVEFINRALQYTFARFDIDPSHLAIGGFSDGASYALSLGLINGDTFSHIIAFSPGFLQPVTRRGKPPIFVSHGVDDRVLPISACSQRFVPVLRAAGYDVKYVEFKGDHEAPRTVREEAVHWFLSKSAG